MYPTPGPALMDGTAGMVDPIDLDVFNEEVKEYMKHHHHLPTAICYHLGTGDRDSACSSQVLYWA